MKRLTVLIALLMLVFGLGATLTAEALSSPAATGNFRTTIVEISTPASYGYLLPICLFNYYSYTQSIYLQSEINVSNQRIEKISYRRNYRGTGGGSNDWTVYMGHTDKSCFDDASDWIPVSEMVKVFEGFVHFPHRDEWVEVELDYPFAYDNTRNLVIAVDENNPGREPDWCIFTSAGTPGQLRSIVYHGYGNPDPNSPTGGALEECVANIRMVFEPTPTGPAVRARPTSINFGVVLSDHDVTSRNLKISNIGVQTLNLEASDISFTGPYADHFLVDSSVLPLVLEPGEYAYLPVSVSANSVGQASTTMQLACDGVITEVELFADIMPAGSIIIGDGTGISERPFSIYYEHEACATLYTAAEMGSSGLITALGWYCNKASVYTIPYKIYAQNTSQVELPPALWYDFAEDLTLVGQGLHKPIATGWQVFQLDPPFYYAGQNLILAVETRDGDNWGAYPPTYTNTPHSEPRTRYWCDYPYTPAGLGQEAYYMPNILLYYSTPNDDPQIPVAATTLHGNYPNPFNPETTISYSVVQPGRVQLEVYNLKGQLVATLADADHAPGHYKQVFNGKDKQGRTLSSGVYLVRMTAPGYHQSSKMVLMK